MRDVFQEPKALHASDCQRCQPSMSLRCHQHARRSWVVHPVVTEEPQLIAEGGKEAPPRVGPH